MTTAAYPLARYAEDGDILIEFGTGWKKLTLDEAERLMLQIDEMLNPWGDPGIEPSESGDFWIAWTSGRVCAIHWDPENGAAYVSADNKPNKGIPRFFANVRFRRRRTPEVPS